MVTVVNAAADDDEFSFAVVAEGQDAGILDVPLLVSLSGVADTGLEN